MAPIAGAPRARRSWTTPRAWWRMELLCACRALEFRRPLKAGEGCEMLYGAVRRIVGPPGGRPPARGPVRGARALGALERRPLKLAEEVLSS